jgi:hypothetical protein
MDLEEKVKADLWEKYKQEDSRDRANQQHKLVPNFLLTKLNDPKKMTVACRSET